MEYIIAIPSHKRSTIINGKVIKLLEKHNIDKKKIFIFVEESEIETYKKELPEYQIVKGAKGISGQRETISKYFSDNQKIVSIDDDVEEIYEHNEPIINLDYFIKDTFDFLNMNNLTMAGVYPVANWFFCKPTITTDLRFCAGAFKLYINDHKLEKRKYELLEDYENTLLHYRHSKGVMRYNYIYLKCNYNSGKGGLKEYRNDERKKKEVNTFFQEYISFCKIKKSGLDVSLLKNPH